MSCMCKIKNFRENEGLLCEGKMAGFEGKDMPADFEERLTKVAAMAEGEAKTAAALALYDEVSGTPISEDRVQDPVDLNTIINWCPEVISPFTYTCAANRLDANRKAATDILLAAPQGKLIAFVQEFIAQKGADFSQNDVMTFLIANQDKCDCNAFTLAVDNAETRNLPVGKTGGYANPYRFDYDALAIGAAFGLAFATKPDIAAKAAMTFASTAFLKAGVFGAMWMAALLAHAICISDPEVYMNRSLASTPIPSVFFRKVSWMQRNLNCLVKWEECRDEVRGKWCEDDSPFALHNCMINAMAIAASLLYTKPEPDKAAEYVAQCGLQSESNQAYVKAIVAMVK